MEIAGFSPYLQDRYAAAAQGRKAGARELSPDDQRAVQRLQETDRKVRQHEQAHLAAAAGLAMSGASFQYTDGPDGKRYATAGEVRIDVSPGREPQETIDKAKRIRAAALAPADPSPQDRAVAASAGQMEAEARVELGRQRQEEMQSRTEAKQSDRRTLSAYAQAHAPDLGSLINIRA